MNLQYLRNERQALPIRPIFRGKAWDICLPIGAGWDIMSETAKIPEKVGLVA